LLWMKSYVDQFLSASHFVVANKSFWKTQLPM